MPYSEAILDKLTNGTDLEWFDAICEILKKDRFPSAHRITEILGSERPNPKNETRGSKFLTPFDKRFDGISINPDLSDTDSDRQLDFLGFYGKNFSLNFSDILARFPSYLTALNTYDGGTQFFIYPVPEFYEFTAIDLWTEQESLRDGNHSMLKFNNVTFWFGSNKIEARDGYGMRR